MLSAMMRTERREKRRRVRGGAASAAARRAALSGSPRRLRLGDSVVLAGSVRSAASMIPANVLAPNFVKPRIAKRAARLRETGCERGQRSAFAITIAD